MKSKNDLLNPSIQNSLKSLGVGGFDSPSFEGAIKTQPVFDKITDWSFLLDSDIVSALGNAGISGLDGLVNKLSKVRATQVIFEDPASDSDSLFSGKYNDVLNQLGIGTSSSIINTLNKYQTYGQLGSLGNLGDFTNTEISNVFSKNGISVTNPQVNDLIRKYITSGMILSENGKQ
jgi:hypothetical protein